jgi:hypothetical protein
MTNNNLAVVQPDLEMMWKLAQRVGMTPFVPNGLRGKNENVLACILTGHELGIGAMQALNSINIIDGRPAISPELMRALVFQAGHTINVVENSEKKCVLEGIRSDTGAKATVTWSLDDAKRAGLANKKNWETYPRAMLLARATSELCRTIFPDIIAGMSYTPEEIQSISEPVTHTKVEEPVLEAEVEVIEEQPEPPAKKTKAGSKVAGMDSVSTTVENLVNAFPDAEVIDAELVPGFDERKSITSTWGGWPLIKGMASMAARGLGMEPPENAIDLCNKERLWVEVNRLMEDRKKK